MCEDGRLNLSVVPYETVATPAPIHVIPFQLTDTPFPYTLPPYESHPTGFWGSKISAYVTV